MEKIRKAHLAKINKMLMSMAQGNFFYRLDSTYGTDNVEAMTIMLNMLAEEIQESLVHGGFVNTEGVVKHLVQMSFLLDVKGKVGLVNQEACMILSYLRKDLIGYDFRDLLHPSSRTQWDAFIRKAGKRDHYDAALDLTLVTKDGLLVPRFCHMTSCLGGPQKPKQILITVVLQTRDTLERQESLKRKSASGNDTNETFKKGKLEAKEKRVRLSYEDIRKIRKGRTIIMNNLERDFPSLKEFAHQLGTNEFKLKYGFKELYGTTVFRFLLQERLRKAKMLIEHTDSPMKTIAYKTGFKSIPHFSRVFKKNYGQTPSSLRKLS
ncbi:helix-turn-helix domain-containing protein [Maribacter sp. PR1]|uniref:Helix-turn-helix domain-containing protein n=1 Tax=Maribacter cobaltidurans TaxID=1178778 RepID=A0ABU7IY22_9FLAO|nr:MULTISPECIES: helix-turn-helix domain-containing protein [Maribacter]MDC6390496.1 helix-turn-helix domain-containing protein [Maribacter sp. PR1]MEE1977886.1 helix-turn-helix domain-containing protein [Maribacter cobaltidurans]